LLPARGGQQAVKADGYEQQQHERQPADGRLEGPGETTEETALPRLAQTEKSKPPPGREKNRKYFSPAEPGLEADRYLLNWIS